MPPGNRRQSNAMLYTLITFIGLFIIATTVAVIYYVRAEELRTTANDLQDQMDDLATGEEIRQLGNIVGPKMRGASRLGTMTTYLDQMVKLVKGAPIQPGVNAEVKTANTMQTVQDVLTRAQSYVTLPVTDANAAEPGVVDPNKVALTVVMGDLLTELQQTIELKNATEQQLGDLRHRFDDAISTMQQTEQTLTAKVEQYRQQVQDIKTDYNDLRTLVEQNADERVQNLLAQLDEEKATSRQLNQELLKTRAELNVAQERLGDAMAKVREIKPPPDEEAAALTPDGKVVLVDESAGVVHIDLGSEDKVYRGLTFAIYDKTGGIPRDGEPKAEVEVFAVEKKISTARIISSDKKNPIATNDLVANLIWDKDRSNQFVIAGEFDLNGDGKPDYDATRKIGDLIDKWGGVVSDAVSAQTDFVILGAEPEVPPQPTLEQLTVDPMATEKYEAASQRRARYEEVRQSAQDLWVPIFNYDRFLFLTGYASQIGKPGVF